MMKTNKTHRVVLPAVVALAVALGLASPASAARVWNVQAAAGANTGGGFETTYAWANVPTAAFSMGMWVKDLSASWALYTVSMTGCFSLYFRHEADASTRQILRFDTEQQSGASTATVSVDCPKAKFSRDGTPGVKDGAWHFLAVTFSYDASSSSKRFQRIYVDGELVAEKTGADIVGPIANSNANFAHILFGGLIETRGSSYWMNNGLLTGRYSEITYWNRALSASEVASLVSHRSGGAESGMVGYWSLDTPTVSCRNMAKGGAINPLRTISGGTKTVVDDPDFPLAGGVLCVASPQWAQERGYTPSPMASYRTWEDPAVDIQSAVDVAESEEVRVMPGTYAIAKMISVTNNMNVLVTSYDPDTGKPDRAGTVIDCGRACRGFMIGRNTTDDNDEVRGFTVVNGLADNGGGVYLKGEASSMANLNKRCRLVDCTITNCTSTGVGGGVNAYAGLVSNCLMTACTAGTFGGGMCNSFAIQYPDVRPMEYRIATADHCDFVGNTANSQGGGYGNSVGHHWHNMYARYCRFHNNKATNQGGHIDVAAGSWVIGCTFSGDCSAKYGSCMASGSGNNNANPPTVTNCFFVGATSGGGYGYVHPAANSIIVDCLVTNNAYTSSFVFTESCGDVKIRQCLFADNKTSAIVTTHNGSTTPLVGITTLIENCTVAMTGEMKGNSSKSSHDVFQNCILGGTVTSSPLHQAIVSNCIVKALGGTPNPANYNVYIGNNPGFSNPEKGDYSLVSTAFAREKGVKLGWMAGASLDFAGKPRLVNPVGKPYTDDALPDLGCYECQVGLAGIVVIFR